MNARILAQEIIDIYSSAQIIYPFGKHTNWRENRYTYLLEEFTELKSRREGNHDIVSHLLYLIDSGHNGTLQGVIDFIELLLESGD